MEPEVESKKEEPQAEQKIPSLFIRLMPDRTVKVEGCINDKILAYGLLDCAKDAVKDHLDRGAKVIVKPNGFMGKSFLDKFRSR